MFSPALDAHWDLPAAETAPGLASLAAPVAEASVISTDTAAPWQPSTAVDTASWLGSGPLWGLALALLLAALKLAHRRSQPTALLRP